MESKEILRQTIRYLEPLIQQREAFKKLTEYEEWGEMERILRRFRFSAMEQVFNADKKDREDCLRTFIVVNELVNLLRSTSDFTDLENYLQQRDEAILNLAEIEQDEELYAMPVQTGGDL